MRSQSGWHDLPINIYDAIQGHLDVGDRGTTARFFTLNLWAAAVRVEDPTTGPNNRDVWSLLGFSLGRCATQLQRLDLSLPVKLPDCYFLRELEALQELHIKCHEISSSLFEAISHLTALTSLQVTVQAARGKSRQEGRWMQLPPSLRRVLLDGFILLPPPWALGHLPGLTELQLSNIGYDNMYGGGVWGLLDWTATQLRVLTLHDCGLECLPPWLSTLSSLKELNLSNNPLEELEDEETQHLSALRQLRRLDVAKVLWEELPEPLLRGSTLRHLSMHSSPALLVPGTYLKGLTSLHLGWNQLAACVPELAAATALKQLHIRRAAWNSSVDDEDREVCHSVHGDVAATVLATVAELPSLATLVLDFEGIKPCSMAALEAYHRLRSQRPEVRVQRQLRVM
ncbi:hypothetical protein N2152v2_009567 [Parachlorella kessleri]